MPARTDMTEALSFDGPLSVWQGVFLGVLLAAMAYYTLFRVPVGARRRVAPLLWLLRVAAIAVLVLILVGPVSVRSYRHETPRSLAVVTDVSGSMSIVDPPDARNDLRWKASNETGAASTLISLCDRAAVAAAAARDNLAWLRQEEERASRPDEARRRIHAASRAAEKTAELVRSISEMFKTENVTNPELLRQAGDVASALQASQFDQIESRLDSSSATVASFSSEQLNQLEDWHKQMVQSARALSSLAEQFVTELAAKDVFPAANAELLARNEKVARLLESAEKKWNADEKRRMNIRRYTFAQEAVSLAAVPVDANPAIVAAPTANSTHDAGDTENSKDEAFTNLSSVLARLNQDSGESGIEAVFLFTDGRHNDPKAEDPRMVAKAFGDLPVYTVPVGSSRMPRDLVLHHIDAPTAIVEGDQIVVEAILSAFACEGESTVVELWEGKNVVAREEIHIDSPRRDYRVRLVASAKEVGRHEFSLAATELKEEAVPANNVGTFGVDVIDATLKVLLADDMPRWEYRYLVNLFERDERIEYEQLLFHPKAKASGELASQLQLPRDVEGWARFRVAILGDLAPAEFDAQSQKALVEYVSVRGGTVILIAGSESMPQAYAGMPLEDLLPVQPAETHSPEMGYHLELSPEARLIPAMQISDHPGATEDVWRDMSSRLPVYSLSSFCAPKTAARTLIRANLPSDVAAQNSDASIISSAFLCWQTVGRGRVVYIASPTVYQLRLRHGDRYHYRFWGQLIRWAVARDLSQGSRTVKLGTDRSRTAVGQNVQIFANLSDVGGRPVGDAEVRAQASIDQTPVAQVEMKADPNIPGRYQGEYVPSDAGTLTFQAVGADVTQLLQTEGISNPIETSLVVDPLQSTETEDTRANMPLLHQIAQLTHGQVVQPTAVQELIELTDLDPNVTEETVRTPTWNRWNFLLLLCGVLCIEWTIRKKTGLP